MLVTINDIGLGKVMLAPEIITRIHSNNKSGICVVVADNIPAAYFTRDNANDIRKDRLKALKTINSQETT